MPRWSGAFVAVLLLLGAPLWGAVPVLAEEPNEAPSEEPSAETRERAREAYARGQALFHAGQHEEAEQAFQEAYDLIPNPLVLLGIAETREARGDSEGAIKALERYLDERAIAPDRERIEARIDELRPRPAVVRVETDPPGATVYVDGEEAPVVTPAEIEVEPGRHTVDAVLEGYMPARATIEAVSGGRHEITGALQPQPEEPPTATEEEAFGAGEALVTETPEGPTAQEPDKPAVPVGVWITTGVAAGALVTGTVLGFLALQQQKHFAATPSSRVANRGERFALFADLTLGLALGAAITALVLYLTRDDGKKKGDADDKKKAARAVEIAPAATYGGGGLSARLRF
jgi:tetratricopeptide (TPR) repeat protein